MVDDKDTLRTSNYIKEKFIYTVKNVRNEVRIEIGISIYIYQRFSIFICFYMLYENFPHRKLFYQLFYLGSSISAILSAGCVEEGKKVAQQDDEVVEEVKAKKTSMKTNMKSSMKRMKKA